MQAARQALHRGETRQSFTGKFASFHGAGESSGGGRGVSDYPWKQASPLPDEDAGSQIQPRQLPADQVEGVAGRHGAHPFPGPGGVDGADMDAPLPG